MGTGTHPHGRRAWRNMRWVRLSAACLSCLLLVGAGGRNRQQKEAMRYTCVVLEDAEDGMTDGWDVYDPTPPGTVTSEAEGAGTRNRVIMLSPEGSSWDTGFRFTIPEEQRGHSKLQWRMRFQGRYTIYVFCDTSVGTIYVQYMSGDNPHTFDGKYSAHTLGGETGIGVWATVRRDLQADFWAADPKIEFQAVRAVMVRGEGMIDDLRLYDYPDADHDLLPDDFERRRKLDPDDASDATARLVEEAVALTDSATGEAEGEAASEDREGKTDEAKSESKEDKLRRYRVALSTAEREGLQAYFDEQLAKRLGDAPKPEIGRTYRVRMRTGEEIAGRLEGFADGRIALRTPHGQLVLPIHRVSRQDTLALFPREAARQQAMGDVQRRVDHLIQAKIEAAEKAAGTATVATAPPADVALVPTLVAASAEAVLPAPDGESAAASLPRMTRVGRPTYDSRPAPTPEDIKPAVLAFGKWLKAQHRRVGGRIASAAYAKEQQGNAVLYLVMDPTFQGQDYDLRHRMAVGIQQFWAFRCQGMGVADLASAHLVMVDANGRIVGGSRSEDATDIWVAE